MESDVSFPLKQFALSCPPEVRGPIIDLFAPSVKDVNGELSLPLICQLYQTDGHK
jgi:hypothetical protein